MKRSIAAIAVLASLSLVSCRKDYTCDCQRIRTDEEGNSTSTNEATYTFTDTKVRAESKCNDKEGSGSDILGDYTIECQIK